MVVRERLILALALARVRVVRHPRLAEARRVAVAVAVAAVVAVLGKEAGLAVQRGQAPLQAKARVLGARRGQRGRERAVLPLHPRALLQRQVERARARTREQARKWEVPP
jgi:hypothetical protein